MPTSRANDQEVQKINEGIELKCGKERKDNSKIGKYGLGHRNPRRDRLVELCNKIKFVVDNTTFSEHEIIYTQKMPGDIILEFENNIDYWLNI